MSQARVLDRTTVDIKKKTTDELKIILKSKLEMLLALEETERRLQNEVVAETAEYVSIQNQMKRQIYIWEQEDAERTSPSP